VCTFLPLLMTKISDMASVSAMDLDNTTPASAPTQELDTNTGLDLGNVYKQCSTARMAASTMTFSVIKDGTSSTHTQTTPNIGTLNWEGD
jgi:hypothetical protein